MNKKEFGPHFKKYFGIHQAQNAPFKKIAKRLIPTVDFDVSDVKYV